MEDTPSYEILNEMDNLEKCYESIEQIKEKCYESINHLHEKCFENLKEENKKLTNNYNELNKKYLLLKTKPKKEIIKKSNKEIDI